jgi:hypothetical protein
MDRRLAALAPLSAAGRPVAFDPMAARQQPSIDLDAEVAAILRAHAAETHLSEGEIIDRAIRANDLRSLLAQIRP